MRVGILHSYGRSVLTFRALCVTEDAAVPTKVKMHHIFIFIPVILLDFRVNLMISTGLNLTIIYCTDLHFTNEK